MDLPISWYSGTTAVNQSRPKWHALLSVELPFSQQKESQSFMFQSLSPQPFLLFLKKAEGIAVTHKSSVSRTNPEWVSVFKGGGGCAWYYTVPQRHGQLRGGWIPQNQVAVNFRKRPSVTLLAGSHCSETNSGLKLLLHLGTWVSSLTAHLPNSSLQKICWRRKRFGHVLYSNRLIGELILEARNRILDHSHPEGISAWISFFLLFVWFGLGSFFDIGKLLAIVFESSHHFLWP